MEVKAKVNPALCVLCNLAALASILFILSMTLIPALERLFFRDINPPCRTGGEEGRGGPERVRVKPEKKNHAR